MSERILFPDAVALVIGYLSDQLDDDVVGRVPNPRPARFVRVQRVGGARTDFVRDNATLTVEAWAEDDDDAMALAELARSHVHAMAGTVVDGVTIGRTGEFAGPGLLPDPESDQPRATQTLTIETRGAAA